MRSFVLAFLLFSSNVFAATCSDIWPVAVTSAATQAPDTPAGLSYSGVINGDTTFADGQTEFAVESINLSGNDSIEFEGTGTRVLYVQNGASIGGNSSINEDANVNLVIVIAGAMNLNGSPTINGVVYVAGSSSASGSNVIVTGAVTSGGATTITDANVNYDAALVAAVSDSNACEPADTGLSYPYSTGFEGDNAEWDLAGDFSISNDTSGDRTPLTGSYVLDNNSEDIDQARRFSGHTTELNEFIAIPADAALPELSFFYKLNVIDSNDRFRVHIYSQANDSWRLEWTVNDEQNNDGYRFASIDLSRYIGDSIKVRFQQRITSYTAGSRLFLVDDLAIQDRPTVDFSYPYTNGFEVGEEADWYTSADMSISNAAHNDWQANTGTGFLDNNRNEITQRRHYNHHWAMMSGFVEIPADADQPTLSFSYKMDVNDSNDRYFIEIQTSDSTSWTRLATLREEDDINHFAKFDYYLADSYKGSKVRIRIRQYITSYDSSVRLFVVDDFRIGDKEVDSSLSYPYSNTFESASEIADWNARGDVNISTASHDTDYEAYQGSGFIDNNPDFEDQRRHYQTHLIEMSKYVTIPNEDDVVLNFFYKLNVLDSRDRIFIEIQTADSTNWARIETLSEQHNHATYSQYEASLAAYKNQTVRIRFRQYITSYTNGARLFVADNFYIGPQLDSYFDFPYFNDFETETSVININQDDSDDVNGRDQWNHEGDWDISGLNDTSVDPQRTSYSGDWYLNNNGLFNEDQRRHYINHEMSMAGYVLVPADAVVPEASFFYKMDVFDSRDRFFFEYQIQGSSSWVRIQTFSEEQEHHTYTQYRYTLPDALKGQYVRFRFRQYITSYTNGVRHFTVDDFRLSERQLDTYDYPYFNDLEADVSTVEVDGDDSNDINGIDHWNHQGDWGVSKTTHNDYEPRSGDGFIDNNPLEKDQRRHYSGHSIEMNGAVTVPSDASEPELTFYYKLDVFDTRDRFFVDIQRSDSSSWTRLRTLSLNDEHDAYTKATISLASYKGDSVRIRFRQYITSYTNGTRVFTVDDVRIGDKTVEYYDFPYFTGFEDETSDDANGINGRDQWNHEGDWYFSDTTHGDSDQASARGGSWYLDSNRDDEDQARKYSNQITEMLGYVSVPADADGAVLSFDYKLHVLDSSLDRYYLEVQELGSTSWSRLEQFDAAEATSTYLKYTYDLDRYLGRTIRVRFRTRITSYTTGPRYFTIDNFKIGYEYVGYWPLEGTLDDISGFDNHATAGGSDPIEYFKVNPASTLGANSTCTYIEFTGNNYMTIPDTEDHHLIYEYTVSAWVNPQPDPSTGNHYSYLKTIASKDANYEFHLINGRVNWWWGGGDRQLTSSSVVPLNEWTHIAITYRSGEQNIYINGVLDATTNSTSAVDTSPYPFYIGTDVHTPDGYVIPSRAFDGLIDEVRIYETFMDQSEIEDDMMFLRPCEQPIDHIRIEHNGSGVACMDHTVDIKVCSNEDCTELYTGDDVVVTLQKDEGGTVTDLGTYTVLAADGELQDVTFTDTSVATWNFTASVTDISDIQCLDESNNSASCAYQVAASGLVVTSGDNGTALSCSATTFNIQAVKMSDDVNSGACVPAFASGNYPLTFEMNYSEPSSVDNAEVANIEGVDHAGGVEGSSINVAFNSEAEATIDVSYAEAGEINIAVKDPTNVLASTTATLGYFPNHLAVRWEANDGTGQENSSEVTLGAGNSDNVLVVGQCSDGTETQNFEPEQYNVQVTRSVPSDTAIASAGLTKATAESFQATSQTVEVNGAATAIDVSSLSDPTKVSMTYDEHATLSVSLSSPYLGQTIGANQALTPTFTPTYYRVTNNEPVLTNTCNSFSYIGQEIGWLANNEPEIVLTGYNAKDQITQFSDANWLFNTGDMETAMALNLYTEQTDNNNNVTATGNVINIIAEDETDLDGAVAYTIADQTVQYVKTVNPDVPFTSDLNLNIPALALTDSNDVGVKESNGDAAFSDHVIEGIGGATNQYGRLFVENSFGSELENLAWVAQVQFYNSSSQWQINTSDVCSALSESAITLQGKNEFYFDNTTGYVLDESLAVTYLVQPSMGNSVTSSSGFLTLDFYRPGEGNIGGFEVDVNLSSELYWLRWDWDGNNLVDDDMPTTSVIFGRYRGNDRIIYKRER